MIRPVAEAVVDSGKTALATASDEKENPKREEVEGTNEFGGRHWAIGYVD